jgi:uncharacterized protein YecE (DUF72 family)
MKGTRKQYKREGNKEMKEIKERKKEIISQTPLTVHANSNNRKKLLDTINKILGDTAIRYLVTVQAWM